MQSNRLLRADPLPMIHGPLLQVILHLPIILTDMLRIPPIAPTAILPCVANRESGRCAFQSHIARTHNCLSKVLEAVVDVPGHLDGLTGGDWQLECVVCLEYGIETVQLVGYGRCVDVVVGVVVDRLGEVVVLRRIRDIDVAQTLLMLSVMLYRPCVGDRTGVLTRYYIQPRLRRLWAPELRRVFRRKNRVRPEGHDLL
jgi:hypothetical protein